MFFPEEMGTEGTKHCAEAVCTVPKLRVVPPDILHVVP
jgi:hypothetical protein